MTSVFRVTDFVRTGAYVGTFTTKELAEKEILRISESMPGARKYDFSIKEEKLDVTSEDYI